MATSEEKNTDAVTDFSSTSMPARWQACLMIAWVFCRGVLMEVWKTSFRASSGAWGPDAQALALHKTLLDAIQGAKPKAAEAAALALIARATERISAVYVREAAARGRK